MVIPFLYSEHKPHRQLRPHVQAYWRFRRTFRPGKTQTIYPDSFYELIWVNKGVLTVNGLPAPRLFLGGFSQSPLHIGGDGPVELWAVRFKPWGLVPFFETAACFAPAQQAFHDVLQDEVYAELTALFERATTKTYRQLLDDYFLGRLATARLDSAMLDGITASMLQSQGAASITDIARQCELSPRQLERIIQKATGKTPRDVMARIRFEHARRALHASPRPTLAAIAAECGYSDQSHLVKDFQRFTELTPLQFHDAMVSAYAHVLRPATSPAGRGPSGRPRQ